MLMLGTSEHYFYHCSYLQVLPELAWLIMIMTTAIDSYVLCKTKLGSATKVVVLDFNAILMEILIFMRKSKNAQFCLSPFIF